MDKETEYQIFTSNVFEYQDEYPIEMLQEFCDYWCTLVTYKGEKIYRFQKNFTFNISMRLKSWRRSGQPGKTKEQQRQVLELQKEQFKVRVFTYSKQYDFELLQDFFDYWSETNEQGSAMRWQKQPTFNLNLRLKTWAKRVNQFKQQNNGNKNYRKSLNREERLQEEARIRRQQYQEGFDILTGRSPQLPPDGGPAAQLPDLRELPPSV